MTRTPYVQIPSMLQPVLESVLVSDSMGIRFQDAKKFCSNSLKEIQSIFVSADAETKKTILVFLRECARSIYIMPTHIPSALQKVPILNFDAQTNSALRESLREFSKNELALPAFHLADSSQLVDLLSVWEAVFITEYRGPLFFCKTGSLNADDRRMGILNSQPAQSVVINPTDIAHCIQVLKSQQWFRNRVLSVSEPWMYSGIVD